MAQKLLITGGSGLLAVNWAAARKSDDEIWLGLHQRTIIMDKVHTVSLKDGIEHAICSVSPDVIIHTAAMTDVEGCENNNEQALMVNRDLAETYAEAAHRRSISFVHISTDHLFDGYTPMLDETAPCKPVNNYGHSKLMGERAALDANPNTLVLRLNFFGWGPKYRPSFSDWIINSLSNQDEITLYENVYFTPLYVGDVIHSAHKLLAKKAQGIYHLTSNDRLSKYDFGMKLAKAFDLDVSLISSAQYDTKKGVPRPLDMSLDNTKIRKALNGNNFKIDDAIAALKYNRSLITTFSSIDQHTQESVC